MNAGEILSAGGGGSGGPLGGAGAGGGCAAFAAAGAAGFAGGVGCPVAALGLLLGAVCAAAGVSGLRARGSGLGGAGRAAPPPAPRARGGERGAPTAHACGVGCERSGPVVTPRRHATRPTPERLSARHSSSRRRE